MSRGDVIHGRGPLAPGQRGRGQAGPYLSPVLIKCEYIFLYNFLKILPIDMKYSEYM